MPSIEQSSAGHPMKKWSHDLTRRPLICLPVTQIEKFQCGTIGPRLHPASIVHQLSSLPSISDRLHSIPSLHTTTDSLTDRFYSLIFAENQEADDDDAQAFESIIHWQQQQQHGRLFKCGQSKLQYMHLLDRNTANSMRGRQYPILTDEIDMIDDPNACTIMNKWAFADLVQAEREKLLEESLENTKPSKKRWKANTRIRICFRKRPLTQFEEIIFKEVDIISIVDAQTLLLHIPSITIDNQVFIKNRPFRCDQTFDEHAQISTIYHSTLAPLLDLAIDGNK